MDLGERRGSLSNGGHFPRIDHCLPPDASFDNYSYCPGLVRKLAH